MIPSEVENRIAKYFFHMYLPNETMMKVEETLLYNCLLAGNTDHDELVRLAIEIIDHHLEDKKFK